MTDKQAAVAPTNMVAGLYRRIYAGFITGKRINSVSMEAEAWFWRLHAIADDFGNLYGDPVLLRSYAAPRRELAMAQIDKWNHELCLSGLLLAYQVGGDNYLHIDGFEERQPAGKNGKRIQRFPSHPVNIGKVGGIQVNPGESWGIQCNPENPSPPIPIPIPIPKTKTISSDPASPVAERIVSPSPRKPRKPDPLWDAIKAEWFAGVDDDKLPASHRTRLGRLRRDFAACEGGDTMKAAERLPSVSRAYRERHPKWDWTPEAVLKHWHELNGKAEITPAVITDRIAVQNRLDAELLASCPLELVAEARKAAWSPTVDAAAAEVIRGWQRNGRVKA